MQDSQDSEEWTPSDKMLAALWRRRPAEWAPGCIDPEDLIGFVEQGDRYPNAASLARHVEHCDYCLREYAALREAYALSREEQRLISPPALSWRKRARMFLKLPHVRLSLQLSGATLLGAAGVLLLLVPFLTARQRPAASQVAMEKAEAERAGAESQSARTELEAARTALAREQARSEALQRQVNSGKENTNSKKLLQFGTTPEGETAEALALRTHHIDFPVARLTQLGKTEAVAGNTDDKEIQVLRPRGTVIQSLSPTFEWKPFPGATRYELALIDPIDSKTRKGIYKNSEIRPDALETEVISHTPQTVRLKEGKTYIWTVNAYDSGDHLLASSPADQEIRFGTLDRNQLDEIQNKRSLYAHKPLLRAILYARLGVLDDAEAIFADHLKAHPQDTGVRRLLEQVQKEHKSL